MPEKNGSKTAEQCQYKMSCRTPAYELPCQLIRLCAACKLAAQARALVIFCACILSDRDQRDVDRDHRCDGRAKLVCSVWCTGGFRISVGGNGWVSECVCVYVVCVCVCVCVCVYCTMRFQFECVCVGACVMRLRVECVCGLCVCVCVCVCVMRFQYVVCVCVCVCVCGCVSIMRFQFEWTDTPEYPGSFKREISCRNKLAWPAAYKLA